MYYRRYYYSFATPDALLTDSMTDSSLPRSLFLSVSLPPVLSPLQQPPHSHGVCS